MSKMSVMWRASWVQLRLSFWIVVGLAAASALSDFIVYLSIGFQEDSSGLSTGNLLIAFLILMPCILPVVFFHKMINLGATRSEYYQGVWTAYTIMALLMTMFNSLWLQLENGLLHNYRITFNIINVFHWDQFGFVGMFLYQLGFYMLLISVLHLLFSGLRHVAGWVLWFVIIAAIPIGTSIPVFRPKVADAFVALLFNDSLWQGMGWILLVSAICIWGGWLFTRRRPLAT